MCLLLRERTIGLSLSASDFSCAHGVAVDVGVGLLAVKLVPLL